jgi:hypothetical protein
MEDLFHRDPPFALLALDERLLARIGQFPPSLRVGIGGHLGHIGFEVAPNVLEVAEEIRIAIIQLSQKD